MTHKFSQLPWSPPRRRLPSKHKDNRWDHCQVEDMEYTEEELTFFRAMDKFKTDNHIPFPTLRETMQVLLSLGYSRTADANGRAERNPCGRSTMDGRPRIMLDWPTAGSAARR